MFTFIIFFGRLYEKDHVVGLLAPEQKRRAFMLLFFKTARTRKTMQWDYLREVIKEKWSLISFSLLEEGEVDDGAD